MAWCTADRVFEGDFKTNKMRHSGTTGIKIDCFDCALCCQDRRGIKFELLPIDSTAALCLSRWRCRMKTIATWIE